MKTFKNKDMSYLNITALVGKVSFLEGDGTRLGRGAQGTTFRTRLSGTTTEVATKATRPEVWKLNPQVRICATREIDLLQRIHDETNGAGHPHIIKLLHSEKGDQYAPTCKSLTAAEVYSLTAMT